MNKLELLEKMGKLPPNDKGLRQGKSFCPYCGVELTHNEYHQCISRTKASLNNKIRKTIKCSCGRRAKYLYTSQTVGAIYGCVCGRGISDLSVLKNGGQLK